MKKVNVKRNGFSISVVTKNKIGAPVSLFYMRLKVTRAYEERKGQRGSGIMTGISIPRPATFVATKQLNLLFLKPSKLTWIGNRHANIRVTKVVKPKRMQVEIPSGKPKWDSTHKSYLKAEADFKQYQLVTKKMLVSTESLSNTRCPQTRYCELEDAKSTGII